MTKDTTIGERFKAVRDEFGLSQTALGELIGVKKSYISKIERGERDNPDPQRMSLLCTKLWLHYDWLMSGTGVMKKNPEETSLIVEEDGGLPYGSVPPRYNTTYDPASSIRLRDMSDDEIFDLMESSIPQLREMSPGKKRVHRCHYVMDFLFEISNRKK